MTSDNLDKGWNIIGTDNWYWLDKQNRPGLQDLCDHKSKNDCHTPRSIKWPMRFSLVRNSLLLDYNGNHFSSRRKNGSQINTSQHMSLKFTPTTLILWLNIIMSYENANVGEGRWKYRPPFIWLNLFLRGYETRVTRITVQFPLLTRLIFHTIAMIWSLAKET